MILNIPAIPPSPNVLRRKYRNPHVYQRLRNSWESWLLFAPQGTHERDIWRKSIAYGAKVRLNVRLYHKGTYDPDNLVGCLKPVIDALVRVKYLLDDSAKYFELGQIEQIRSTEKRTVLHLLLSDEAPHAA